MGDSGLPPLLLDMWSTGLQDDSERSELGPPTWTRASPSQSARSAVLEQRASAPGAGAGHLGSVVAHLGSFLTATLNRWARSVSQSSLGGPAGVPVTTPTQAAPVSMS